MEKFTKGFTLVELMIVVAIIGVLTAIAVPNYNEYMRKTYRAEAKAVMSDLAQKEERFFTATGGYQLITNTASDNGTTWPNYAGGSSFANRRYTIGVSQTTTADFTITATPVVSDPECGVLTFTSAGVRSASGTLGNACW